MSSATTVTLGNTLTVGSGAVANVGGGVGTFTGGTIAFGGQEGVVTAVAGSDLVINSNLNGTNGVTKSGYGLLTLGGSNNSMNLPGDVQTGRQSFFH